jgi:hypothetical protein
VDLVVLVLASLLAVNVLAQEVPPAQTSIPSAAEFSAADLATKRRLLAPVTTSRSVRLDRLIDLVRVAMRDPAPNIRQDAMRILQARVSMSRSAGTRGPLSGPPPRGESPRPTLPSIPAEWKNDQQKLVTALYEDVVRLLRNDPDPKVRHEALLAAEQLQLHVQPTGLDLADTFVALLVDRYRHDPAVPVRAEIVKTFSLIATDSPVIRAVLRDALVDPEPSIRFVALSHISGPATLHPKLSFVDARETVAAALTSRDAGVRLGAVQALNYFGKAAREYVATLQSMSERDSDPHVRESAALAVAAIHRDGG